METQRQSQHVRHQHSLLSSIEKRILIWIAKRLPVWLNSDHLTLLGFLAMLGIGLSYWASVWDSRALILAIFGLAVNWFGDSLDGTLARVRRQQRPRYGFYVDHVVDIVGSFFLLGGLAASGYMNPFIGLGLLIGFLMVSAERYLATHVLGVFRLSFMGMGPTELRILLAVGTLFLFYKPVVQLGNLGSFNLFDVGGASGIVGMAVTLIVSSIRNARFLYQAEPLGRR